MSAVKQRSGQRTSCWARSEHARQGTSHSPLFCCSTFQAIWKLRSATLGGSRSGADNMDAMSDTSFHTHSLGSKSTSSSGFLPGLGGCIVPFHPVRAVTVAKRREYEPIQTYTLYTKLVFQWCGVSHDLSIYYKMAIQCSSYGVETC